MAEAQTTQVIASLEDQTWRVLSKNGADFLPFLSTDCQMLMPFGMQLSAASEPSIKEVMTSDAFIPWKAYKMSDVVVTPVGSDGAAISYRVRASRPNPEGEDSIFKALISSVWRKDEKTGAWQMCLHQQTPFDHGVEDLL
ncbi:hypothetical protein PMZ80_011122 [Knufia obscura]|uniref:DUF4440 domain-containing protein n=2 Tax=Knufia TaxID=430999 RepID=A0AAN8ECD1_9EURO|nr:hypothetical protein PMZ80_011122 [Knufia obscura]KAK5947978.1 hypothetical protein OHC33_011019 [Knufia fluminis]